MVAAMVACRFGRYELLTTDIPGARAFYAQLFGAEFWGEDVTAAALPERALAMGARPHFRAHLGVSDVERTLAQLVAEGGQQLGPLLAGPGGAVRAGVRDPFGAVLALSSEVMPLPRACVGWHLLAVREPQKAFALYRELFGWHSTQVSDGGLEGEHHQFFGWDDSGRSVGSVTDTARKAGVHAQWLFFFRVANLSESLAAVRALGGAALPSMRTSDGAQVAACDDPQGAAFGLYQSP